MTNPSPSRLMPPGLKSQDRIKAAIRVDHAGEFGAVRIYEGQLAVLGRNRKTARTAALVAAMKAGEAKHLETFDRLALEHRVRPTMLQPFWHVAGFALGAVTALISEKTAFACTAAVEAAIDAHYGEQSVELAQDDPALVQIIDEFRADEAHHRETALENGAEQAPFYRALAGVITLGCRIAIAASTRI